MAGCSPQCHPALWSAQATQGTPYKQGKCKQPFLCCGPNFETKVRPLLFLPLSTWWSLSERVKPIEAWRPIHLPVQLSLHWKQVCFDQNCIKSRNCHCRCEVRRDPCVDSPCRNGGRCRSRRGEVGGFFLFIFDVSLVGSMFFSKSISSPTVGGHWIALHQNLPPGQAASH